MSGSFVKWVVFALLCAVVPVLFFAFVFAAFVPLVVIVVWMFRGPNWYIVLCLVHVLVYAPLAYGLAKIAGEKLMASPYPRFTLAVLCAFAVAASFLPVYGGGHSVKLGKNLYELLVGP